MPRDQKGKNRKVKHDRQSKRQHREVTQEQIERVQRYARGQDVNKQQQEEQEHQKQIEEKYKPKPINFVRNYDVSKDDEQQEEQKPKQSIVVENDKKQSQTK